MNHFDVYINGHAYLLRRIAPILYKITLRNNAPCDGWVSRLLSHVLKKRCEVAAGECYGKPQLLPSLRHSNIAHPDQL